ncbi:MAG: GEVED domain-containing protein, partial [Brumimicrobium sp.]
EVYNGTDADYTVIGGVSDTTFFRLTVTCTNSSEVVTSNIMEVTLKPENECYCIPSATNMSRYIDDFTTTDGIQNITNDASGFSPDGYGDFTSMVASHYQGEEVNFTASFGGTTTFGFKIWIDWSQDGVFDASEVVFQTSSYSNTHVGSFTVPLTALPGQTRMRIGNSNTPNSGPADPCEIEYSSGEFEDYTFEIIALPACAGIPDAGTLTDMEVCADFDFTLASSGVSDLQSGLTYLWESSPDQVTWTEVYNGTDADYTVIGGVSDTTFFRLTVTCTNSSEVVTSNIMEVTLKPENVCYCIPEATNVSRYIDDFATTGGTQNITNDASGFSTGGYGDFTSLIASQFRGGTVNFDVNYGGTSTYGFKIWIDWEQDGVFDASDVVYETSSYSSSHSGSFTVPPTALTGTTRMRIGNSYTPNSGPTNPCVTGYSSGEFEDYTFIIEAIDAPIITQNPTVPDCITGTELTLSGDISGGYVWYWQVDADSISLDNSTNPLVVYENGTYYAKTYDPATGGWSDASSITVSNIPVAPAPSVPVAAQNPACLPGTTISMDNMDPTLDYYWQGTDDMASDMTDPATVPYDVTTTGTYYVKAHDPVSGCWSEPVGLLVEVGTLIPPAPIVTDSLLYVCTNSTSVMLDAQTVVNTNGSLTTTLAGGNGCGGGAMFDLVVTTNVNITGFDVVPNSNGAQDVNVYYKTGSYQGSQTTPSDWTLAGTYPITGANGVPSFIDITDIPLVAGQNYGFFINYNADYTNEPVGTTYTDGLMTLTVGEGICTTWSSGNAGRAFNGTIYYGENIPAEAAWYDAMTGGNFISNDNPLEAVGTSVMPTAADGTYEFYVASSLEGCESPERVLVTVNVAPVNVTLTAQDVSCNNGNDGTFFIDGTPDCGVPPFTYSVDGGAFGPIPTDLVPGEHTVIVKDDTGAESAEYTIEVGDAPAPDGIIINSISDDMVNVSWNAGSAETAWYVEWGDNTYVPGSGTPIGSITVTDTTHIITGLSPSSSYNIYVYASCGGATSVGEWTTLEVTTTCAPVPALGYCEDFEVISDLGCWIVEDGNEDGELFAIYTDQGYNSAQSGGLDVRTSPTTNDDYIVLPQLTLTGNEVMTFYQKTYASGTVNYEILLSHDELKFTDLDTVYTNVVSGTTWTKVTVDLSAFTGDVFIMLHVGPGSTSGSYVFFDDICIDVCIPVAGVDGVTDVCSEDGSLDLFTTIQSDYNHGSWIFNGNQNLVNGSELSLTYLTDGTYELMYIVDTECTSDTTFSTINVSLPSSAGIGGSITVCKNQPINLFAALSGNVDFGGDWYDYNNQLTPTSHPTSPQFPGSYNYYYVVSNGVCDADTAVVAVNVSSACDWSSVSEEMFGEVMVYPNPASEIIYISSSTNTSDFKLELLDINGRVVYKNDDVVKQNTQTSIDINNLARGVYTLRVFNDDGQRNFKVVKR